MYTAVELKNLTIKPKINDITLDVLREFYEIFLYPFIYIYTITRNEETRTISLRFNTHNKPDDRNIYIDAQEQITATKENRVIML